VGLAARSQFRSEGPPCTEGCRDLIPDAGWVAPMPLEAFTCTQVIGFSQTRQWYEDSDFEALIGDSRWQLLWAPGASIGSWANQNFDGWSQPVESQCVERSGNPDRVLLTISGSREADPSSWAAHIRAAIATLRSKHPDVEQVLLQPVVGGPDDEVCSVDGQDVRASMNQPVIDEAITALVEGNIRAGASPEVRTCSDFEDAKGHLASEARVFVGRAIAEYYMVFDAMIAP
jgi:hypothetical protein